MCRELILVVLYFSAVLGDSPTKLLVVSFDGFRHDYLNESVTPNFLELRQQSTYADYIRNVFPTKSFPNQYSLATGVYVEEHGVIDSVVQEGGVNITYSQRMFEYNPSILPIWIQNEKYGGVSGSMMYLGGEFTYQNLQATFHQRTNGTIEWEEKIGTVISWMKDPRTPANLVMLYFNQPDAAGHHYGPSSPEVKTQVEIADEIVKHLDKMLKESFLDINVFVLSDHGMADITFPKIIDLSAEGNEELQEVENLYTIIGATPIFQVIPTEGNSTVVYEAFSKVANSKGHFKAYMKSELPPEWRLQKNGRVTEILVVADLGYGFHDLLQYTPTPDPDTTAGAHGYDNSNSEMRPFFMAWGPDIKKNFKIPPFDSVDLYVLWCKLLGIPPGKNSGNFDNVKDMLAT